MKKQFKGLINPLALLAARNQLSEQGANNALFAFYSHLFEMKSGTADWRNIKCITVYLAATADVAGIFNQTWISDVTEDVANVWLAATKTANNTIEITPRIMQKLRLLMYTLVKVLQHIESGVWYDCYSRAMYTWSQTVAEHGMREPE